MDKPTLEIIVQWLHNQEMPAIFSRAATGCMDEDGPRTGPPDKGSVRPHRFHRTSHSSFRNRKPRLSTTSDTALPTESQSGTSGSTELSVRTPVNPLQRTRDAWLNLAKRVEGKTVEIEVPCSDLNQHRLRRQESQIFRA